MTVGEMLPGHLDALDAQARIDRELADLDQAICEHQAQICSLRNRMRLLRTQRNSLLLGSLLPPEILEAIFIHWARIYHDPRIEKIDGVASTVYESESTTDESESTTDEAESVTDEAKSTTDGTESLSDGVEEQMDGVPMWVNASHVCRYWRDVALNYPALWSYISPASRRWIQEMLLRSKTTPLKIRFEWTAMDSNALGVLQDLLAHTERIQELRLDFSRHDVEKVFPLLSSPAPLLQSLEIHLLEILELPNESFIFSLFNGVTPALHRLELDRCFVPRAALALGSLTTLILSSVGLSNKPTPSQLHVLLSSMPNLVHLGLHDALAPSRDELATRTTCDSQNTHLPHLLRLSIHEPLPEVISFLTCLHIPSQTEVKIDSQSVDPEDWMKFRTFLLQSLFTSRRCPPCSIAVELQDGMTSIVFCGSENAHHYLQSYSPDWDCNIPLKIKVSHLLTGDQLDFTRDIIGDTDGGGFLAGLQSTSVTLRGNADEDWNRSSNSSENIFGLLPKLRYIEIIGARARLGCLSSFLSLTPHHRDQYTALDQPSGERLTSALEELVVRDCKFRLGGGPGSIRDFYNALATRKKKGFTLTRLALIGCERVFKDDVAKFKDVVSEVTWDGIEEERDREGS